MVRSGRFKYIAFDAGIRREQLFDMERDPGETVSVAEDPAFGAVREAHRAYLKEWCGLTGDSFSSDKGRDG
jgi:hypothetical protein